VVAAGVSRSGEKYRAQLQLNKRCIELGTFSTSAEAAKAYDVAAVRYFGAEALLNFPNEAPKPEVKDADGRRSLRCVPCASAEGSWRIVA
jgi:hypothetical protein